MQVFVVARDGHLWNIYWDGTAWHHWVEMGGDFAAGAEVAASTWGPDRIDVFVNSAGELWQRWWDGSAVGRLAARGRACLIRRWAHILAPDARPPKPAAPGHRCRSRCAARGRAWPGIRRR